MSVVIGIMLFMRTMLGTPPGVHDDGLVELVVRASGQLRAQAGSDIVDLWSYPDYLDVRDAARGMTTAGWSRGEGLFRPASQAPSVPLATAYVSSNYFSTVGVRLALGPGFTRADDASLAPAEAVIGHRTWQLRFDGDPGIVGRPIVVNRTEFVVVASRHPASAVTSVTWTSRTTSCGSHSPAIRDSPPRRTPAPTAAPARIRMIGRLSADASLEGANASVQATMATLAAQYLRHQPGAVGQRRAATSRQVPRMRARGRLRQAGHRLQCPRWCCSSSG